MRFRGDFMQNLHVFFLLLRSVEGKVSTSASGFELDDSDKRIIGVDIFERANVLKML